MRRIFLSVSQPTGREDEYLRQAVASNWLTTAGPQLEAFEAAFADKVGRPAVALSSGTAAIHLGLRILDVAAGDDVFCPTLTFVAALNPVLYLGARPVLIDSEASSWNLDPSLLEKALGDAARRGTLPKAVIVVHIYGQSADMDPILDVCQRYQVPVLEDAAEAVGSFYRKRPVGTMGDVGAYSFNGNKIITTGGGGMLVARDQRLVSKAHFLSLQARNPGIGYEHSEMGYNYRMSNLLAAVGLAQLPDLEDRVSRRRRIAHRYRDNLHDLPGITIMPEREYGLHTRWLSCFLVDPIEAGISRDEIITALDSCNIEARPVWKPMHLQPLYRSAECYGGGVAERLASSGLCLPSSSGLSEEDQDFVIKVIREAVLQARASLTAS